LPTLDSPEDLPGEIFNQSFREGLVHQAVVTYEANQRTDLANVKNRSEVKGANQKPWRQKGTGRARHGSRISPLWIGGGQAQAPDGKQDHSKKMTKSMKKGALRSALSVRCQENEIKLLKSIDFEKPNTAEMNEFFDGEGLTSNKLLLLHTPDEKLIQRSTRNLPYCEPFDVNNLNTYQVVSHETILFTESAFDTFLDRVEK
jgi:large subunit ribosomal protein L4